MSERVDLRVISGSATPEDIAAIVAVLAAAGAAGRGDGIPADESRVSRWAAPAARMRPGVGRGWRASALPR